MHYFITCNLGNGFYCLALESATEKGGENGD
jgi:hypothetical protein